MSFVKSKSVEFAAVIKTNDKKQKIKNEVTKLIFKFFCQDKSQKRSTRVILPLASLPILLTLITALSVEDTVALSAVLASLLHFAVSITNQIMAIF